MSIWTAAGLTTTGLGAFAILDRVVGETPLTSGLIGGSVAAAGGIGLLLKRALSEQRQLLVKQAEFWHEILPYGYLRNYEVVYGDPKGLVDITRGNRIPLTVQRELFKASWPMVAAATSKLVGSIEEYEEWVTRWTRHRVAHPTLRTFASWAGSRMRFLNEISPYRRRLLVPLGGAVSNDLAARHLIATIQQRRFHLVAHQPKADKSTPFFDLNAIQQIRQEKDLLNDSARAIDENEAILDAAIQYEVWKSQSAGPSSKMEPLSQPHWKTNRDPGNIHDAILVTVSRASDEILGPGGWIFSSQPLHQLGTVGVDLFWRPHRFLGRSATKFARTARQAIQDSGDVGFESVIEVTRSRKSRGDKSPRVFEGLPELNDVSVQVKEFPSPLVRQT